MKYKIVISPDAIPGYQGIPYEDRSGFRDFIQFRLTSSPEVIDDLTVKDLVGVRGLRFRLSSGEARVFYDVVEPSVEILLILLLGVHKEDGIVIKKQGAPIAAIPKVGDRRYSELELKSKIDASRDRIRSGDGFLFRDLPL
jgi:mRNA-degrading endonuclease RelE of RelBE toxin-antitoxin system